ncbi:MAG: hypothetical protein EXS64_18665 [Candidatus Latescibacteria bacterium]|nr:hypothetical protein [Candidatus Latescibacterota bacterium]
MAVRRGQHTYERGHEPDTVAQNRPPAQSIPRSPADNAVGVPLNPLLVWGRSIDPDGDPVTYDVFLGAGRVKSTTDTALVVGPLSEATDYTWRVAAHDDRGGTVDGTIRRFRTVGDTLAPVVLQGPAAEGITQTTATVLCATDEPSTLQVEYRVRGGSPAFTSSPADSVRRKEHRIGLSGLASGTTYEYRTLARDAAGNLTTFPDPPYPAFTTLAADTTAPQFVAPPSAPFISDSSAVVVWTTDERGTSEAAFRLEADTTFVNALPGEAGTEHRVTLKGLRPGTSYIVRVRSEDASRNAAFASLRIVTPARSAAPVRLRLFNVNVEGRTESQAIIAWSTDRPASGLVRYGLTSLLSPSLAQTGDDGVLEHVVTLTRLSPDTEYFYRVVSAAPLPDSSDLFSFRTLAAARTTPPVILEGPLAQGLGEGRVTIVWRTDEVSTGAVAFDTTAILSRIVTAPGTEKDHAVTLTGLTPGTTYFYQVRSTGLARLSAASRVSSFTTLAARDTSSPTLLEGPTVTVRTSDGFTVDWGTDEISTSEVVYGPPDSLTQSQTVSGLVQRHGVRVSNLRPGTRYAFRVRSADAAGNVRESAAFNVTTLADTLVDRTSPRLVSPPSVAGTTHQEATIVWGTDEPANSLVEFGKSEKALFETQGDPRRFVTAHSVRLTNLSAATTYHYRIASTDAAGNGPAHNPGDLTFTTKAGSDTISARITSGPTVLSVTDRTATLAWTTDELSDTQVDYAAGSDTTASRLREQAVSPEGTTAHRVTLTNLKPDTTYAFRVGSQDLARNFRTFSEGRTFRTQAAPDTVPPDLVSGPTSIEQTSTTATLAWTTDEPTNTVVEYGTKDYSAGQVERGEMEQSHILTLTGLLPDTESRYRIVSRDREGNGITTDPTITIPPPRTRLRASDLRFRTARVADTTPPVIVEGPTVQISGNNVVVRWVTDELANSRVVYALPADYNRPGLESDAFDARPTTVHLITLAELDLNAQYLFRCVSSDAAGNTVTSGLPGRSTKPADGGLALQPPGGDGGFVTAPVADRPDPGGEHVHLSHDRVADGRGFEQFRGIRAGGADLQPGRRWDTGDEAPPGAHEADPGHGLPARGGVGRPVAQRADPEQAGGGLDRDGSGCDSAEDPGRRLCLLQERPAGHPHLAHG